MDKIGKRIANYGRGIDVFSKSIGKIANRGGRFAKRIKKIRRGTLADNKKRTPARPLSIRNW
jgi:predicted RNA-binding protein YlqC (UPF0109 family)